MGKSVESHEKPKNAEEEAAHKTVEDTKKHLKEHSGGDIHGAYNKLIESVRTTHAQLDKHDKTGKSSKTYEEKVVMQLEKEKLLPVLALEYGQRAFEKIDHKDAKSGLANGSITNAEIKAFQQTGKTGVFGHAMLDSLVKQSDKINTGDQYGNMRPGVDQVDIANGVIAFENGATNKTTEAAKASELKAAQNSAKQLESNLFSKPDGKSSLFERADFVGAGTLADRTDKRVGKHDFEALANDPTLPEADRKNIKVNIVDKWDSPAFQRQFLSDGYMTEESIKKATGETDAEAEQKRAAEVKAKADEEAETAKQVKAEAQSLGDLVTKQVDGASVIARADFIGSTDATARADGKVSKQDLETLVKSPNFDPAIAKDIQENIINKMDNSSFQARYMTDGYIDRAKIAKQSGALDPDAESEAKWDDVAKTGRERREQQKTEEEAKKIAEEREKSAALAAGLMNKEPGGQSILERADYVGSSNTKHRTDGLVGKKDLEALTIDPSLNSQTREVIKKVLLGDKWNSPEVKNLRDGDYISVKSLENLVPNSQV